MGMWEPMARLLLRLLTPPRRLVDAGRDRGDVPGWVLVTIMTAGLVTVLWALAGERLQDLLDQALSAVTGPGV